VATLTVWKFPTPEGAEKAVATLEEARLRDVFDEQ
jgi:hypothetical protein